MADDKPKHKPQKKRTLEEVLKTLQDLIRNDLIGAQLPRPAPAPPTPPPAPALSPQEPDSFHDALEKLDEMITHKIIEPVERARETPPEPLLPDEELEIEWSEPASQPSAESAIEIESVDLNANALATTEEITLEPLMPDATLDVQIESPPEPARPEETANLATPAELVPDEPVIALDAGDQTSMESIELQAVDVAGALGPAALETNDEPPAGDGALVQHAFAFDAPREPHSIELTPEPKATSEPAREPAAAPSQAKRLAADKPKHEPAPAQPPERSTLSVVEFEQPREPLAVIEYTPDPKPPAKLPPATETAATTPPSPTDRTVPASERPVVTRKPTSSDPNATDRKPSKAQPASEERKTAAAPNAPAELDIPVLKEIADLAAPPVAPLPDASQARDIAIRVIARLNIERRKSGEKPLDIKTIERLQQYLAEALTKRALNAPK